LKIIVFINVTIKRKNWATYYNSKMVIFQVHYLIFCTFIFYLLQKQMCSRYHNKRTQTQINFHFTFLSALYSGKRIIAMEFLDQLDFHTVGILWRRVRL